MSATPPIPGRGQKGQLSLLGGDGLDMPEFLQRKPQVHYRPAEAAENPPAEEAAEPDNCRTQRPTEERGAGDVPGEPLPAGASTGARACVISGRPWVVPRGEI